MNNQSMIIIGAGVAGLSTGCYARMNGFKTHIFEHHTVPGGLCTAWKRKGYTIDGCIHFLLGCRPNSPFYSICQELGLLKNINFRILKDFSSFLDEKTGQGLVVTSDLERLAVDMKKVAPEDEKIIDEFVNGCRHILGVFRDSNPKIMEFMKSYNMPVAEFAQRFQNRLLKWYITHMLIPEMPMYSMLMILGLLSVGQLGLVDGGSSNLSLSIARQYQNLGGKITYGVAVEEILIENNSAVGVRLADGTEHLADVIVSAADGYSTIFQMLGGKYVDQNILDRYEKWPLFTPIHMISYGVSRQFPDEPSERIICLKEPINTGGKYTEELRLRIFNHDLSLAPEGKTVVQAILYTDFDHWYNLHKNRASYEAEKERVACDLLLRLETLYPGISSLVEMTDVATPYTFWRYTRNHRSSWEGWLSTPEVVKTIIPKTLPGLANFYMAGQWVLPAASIPQAISSGRDLVKILCEQEGKGVSGIRLLNMQIK